jgi:MrcB-like, N-terminal domain
MARAAPIVSVCIVIGIILALTLFAPRDAASVRDCETPIFGKFGLSGIRGEPAIITGPEVANLNLASGRLMLLGQGDKGYVFYNCDYDQTVRVPHKRQDRSHYKRLMAPLGGEIGGPARKFRLPGLPGATVQQSLSVFYLYDVGTRNVFLSMNQGAAAHRQHYVENRPSGMGIDKASLVEIAAETESIRSRLVPALLAGTVREISLGSDLYLPQGYEAGNIAAFRYDLHRLPPEAQLRQNLQQFLILYQECVPARQAVIATNPNRFNVPALPPADTEASGDYFRPKDASDYVAHMAEHTQRRTRKHEALLTAFVKHARGQGWSASTEGAHPRDLLLDKRDQHLLIEAKIVKANSEHAVRECIGQLFAYEFLYYSKGATNKVALFSAPIGPLWVQLLAKLTIDTIWLEGATWKSSGTTVGWV